MKSIQNTIYSALYPLFFGATIVGIATLLLLDPALAPDAEAVSVSVERIEGDVASSADSNEESIRAVRVSGFELDVPAQASGSTTRVSLDISTPWSKDIIPAITPRQETGAARPFKALLTNASRS